MQEILKLAHEYPELIVFAALAIGYFIGNIKIKGFSLGSTASVLLVAIALAQFGADVPALLRNVSFALFAFSIGYKIGPQFFGALRKEGFNYIWVSLVVALVGLFVTIALGKALHFDKGTTAGLFAGSMTQSAAIGTAEGAIDHLSISASEKAGLDNNVAVSYAITYLFGLIGMVVIFKLLPRFIRLDLKDESKKLEKAMGSESDLSNSPGLFSWEQQVRMRACKVTKQNIVGKTVKEIEGLFPSRICIDRIKRGSNLFNAGADTIIEDGDILLIAGNYEGIIRVSEIIGQEVDASKITETIGESLDICVLSPDVIGKTLGELASLPETRGLFLRKLTRQGNQLPITLNTVVNKCDIFKLVGTRNKIERAVQKLGYPVRPTSVTDLLMVGIGCIFGMFLGMIVIPIGGLPITLGEGGGILIAGVIFGWLRSKRPSFGQISDGAQWLMTDFGLNLFVACIGLESGKQAIQALQAEGMTVFLAGILVAIIPVVAGLFFGRKILKMNPILLFGALCGARVIPAALQTLQEDAESPIMAIGFAAPFAIANVILTIMGSVIINIM